VSELVIPFIDAVYSSFVVACAFVAAERSLLCRCLAIAVTSGSTIPAFSHYVTIFTFKASRHKASGKILLFLFIIVLFFLLLFFF
jgi:hypothetical protein